MRVHLGRLLQPVRSGRASVRYGDVRNAWSMQIVTDLDGRRAVLGGVGRRIKGFNNPRDLRASPAPDRGRARARWPEVL